MYDQKLEKLVDMALEDGVITEKEKDILVKRAKSLGIDLDEFEMYLDSRLASLSNTQNTTSNQNKFGNLLKCPSCGTSVPSLTIICKDCGFEFRNIKANSTVKELVDKLEHATITVASEKKTFLSILKGDCWDKVDYLKSGIVANFPIPNTKEDVLEFAIFISSNIDSYKVINILNSVENILKGKASEKWNDVWIKKYKEIIYKAKLLCKDDPSFPKLIINLIKEKNIKIKSEFEKWAGIIFLSSYFIAGIFSYGFFVIFKSFADPALLILPIICFICCSPIVSYKILDDKYGSMPISWDD